jgi:hypothetical protein
MQQAWLRMHAAMCDVVRSCTIVKPAGALLPSWHMLHT